VGGGGVSGRLWEVPESLHRGGGKAKKVRRKKGICNEKIGKLSFKIIPAKVGERDRWRSAGGPDDFKCDREKNRVAAPGL